MAVVDLQAPESGQRHKRLLWERRHRAAVLWLGSSRCALWLDLIGLKATRVLIELQWSAYAKRLLMADVLDEEGVLSGPEKRLLKEGIRRLESLVRKVA